MTSAMSNNTTGLSATQREEGSRQDRHIATLLRKKKKGSACFSRQLYAKFYLRCYAYLDKVLAMPHNYRKDLP